MPKSLSILVGLLSCVFLATSQNPGEFFMRNGSITTCSGTFYDSQGPAGGFLGLDFNRYENNEDLTFTICPDDPGRRIRLFFEQFKVKDNDILCFYDGDSRQSNLLSCWDNTVEDESDDTDDDTFDRTVQATLTNPSGCLTVHWESDGDGRARGWEAVISCEFKCQPVEAVLVNATPAVVPADTGWINVCLGEPVQLTGAGNYPSSGQPNSYNQSDAQSTFSWNMGDGNVLKGNDISHVYEKPGGYIVQLTIKDQLGCRNTNTIDQRIRVAPPPSIEKGMVPDSLCIGDTISLTSSVGLEVDSTKTITVTPGEGGFEAVNIRADSIALPDGEGVDYDSPITFSVFAPGATVNAAEDIVALCVNMEHTWLRDLEIELICPSGQSVLLHDFAGQEGNEVFLGEPIDNDHVELRPGPGYTYCWRNDADLTWREYIDANFAPNSNQNTLPERTFKPVGNFESLVGCPINGDWKMRISDLWLWDNGFIYWWSIEFADYIKPNTEESFIPQISDFSWNGPDITFNGLDSVEAVVQTEGEKSYVFAFEDEFGCSYEETLTTTVLPDTDPKCDRCARGFVALPDTLSNCTPGTPVPLEIRTDPGLPIYDSYTYRWEPALEMSCTDCPNPTISPTQNRTYTVFIENGTTCMVSDTIHFLVEPPTPIILEELRELPDGCPDGGQGVIELTISGGLGNYSVVWNDPVNQEGLRAENLETGTYQATISDESECTEDLVVQGEVLPATPIEAIVAVTPLTCDGLVNGSIVAMAEGGLPPYTYNWSNGTTTAENSNLPPGKYGLTILDQNNCSFDTTITIEEVTPLVVMVDPIAPGCAGGNDGRLSFAVEGGQPPYEYQINGGDWRTTPTILGLPAGSYEFGVRDGGGCLFESMATIDDQLPFSISLISNQEGPLDFGAEVTVEAIPENGIGEINYRWQFAGMDSVACNDCSMVTTHPMRTTTFFTTGTDGNGCTATAQLTLEVDIDRSLEVPTGFTPNGDNINDRLLVHGTTGTKVLMFQVYDRWGQLLYQASDFMVNDQNTGWDGSFRGAIVDPDTYIWYVEAEYMDGFIQSYQGQSTLLR